MKKLSTAKAVTRQPHVFLHKIGFLQNQQLSVAKVDEAADLVVLAVYSRYEVSYKGKEQSRCLLKTLPQS